MVRKSSTLEPELSTHPCVAGIGLCGNLSAAFVCGKLSTSRVEYSRIRIREQMNQSLLGKNDLKQVLNSRDNTLSPLTLTPRLC